MPTIERFEDLDMWKKARTLSSKIYKLTFDKPISDDFRFKDQLRGSVGSIMDNILPKGLKGAADWSLLTPWV